MPQKTKQPSVVIDLTGPEGNAFWLMGALRRDFKKYYIEEEYIERAIADMISSDYKHLLTAFVRAYDRHLRTQYHFIVPEDYTDTFENLDEELGLSKAPTWEVYDA